MAISPTVAFALQMAARERFERRRRHWRNVATGILIAVALSVSAALIGLVPGVARLVPDVVAPRANGVTIEVQGALPEQIDDSVIRKACLTPWFLRAIAHKPAHARVSQLIPAVDLVVIDTVDCPT